MDGPTMLWPCMEIASAVYFMYDQLSYSGWLVQILAHNSHIKFGFHAINWVQNFLHTLLHTLSQA